MPPKLKEKSDTLVRVRNNQRRCRARKREYIAELERKVQDLEALGKQVNDQPERSILKKLEDENTKLRYLLDLAGFSKAWVEAYLTQENNGRETADKLLESCGEILPRPQDEAIDNLETVTETTATDLTPEIYGPGISTVFDDLLDVPFELSGEQFHFFIPSITPAPFSLPPTLNGWNGNFNESSCCSEKPNTKTSWNPSSQLSSPVDLGHLKSSSSDNNSTLCSVAFSLLQQYNKKGVDMIEISMTLWNGFIKGGPAGDGCKVENKLLLSVLEYISS
ncbi:hypothetical protein BGZ60DRAFT_420085 [Tricladium varicosporioides]|nr:hypothetical protein BGZ60DRAFT_420085 [Hymenoscyphus varicosporioides]